MNSNLNRSQDVDYVIKRILMALQRYIMRRHDFKYYRFTLLLSGLLISRHISLWVLVLFFRRLHIGRKVCRFLKKLFIMVLRCRKITGLSLWFHFVFTWVWVIFIGFYYLLIWPPSAHNTNIESRVIGSGCSVRIDYETLKPYAFSTEVQLENLLLVAIATHGIDESFLHT